MKEKYALDRCDYKDLEEDVRVYLSILECGYTSLEEVLKVGMSGINTEGYDTVITVVW